MFTNNFGKPLSFQLKSNGYAYAPIPEEFRIEFHSRMLQIFNSYEEAEGRTCPNKSPKNIFTQMNEVGHEFTKDSITALRNTRAYPGI